MSLTQTDLQKIRNIVREAIAPMEGKLEALENDIKEIYQMIKEIQGAAITDKRFQKLNLKDKLLKINTELLATAKEAGITLPRP